MEKIFLSFYLHLESNFKSKFARGMNNFVLDCISLWFWCTAALFFTVYDSKEGESVDVLDVKNTLIKILIIAEYFLYIL